MRSSVGFGKLGWSGLMAGVGVLTVILLTVAWVGIWHRLDVERQLVLANATQQQENLARIIAENLSQVIDRGRVLALSFGKVSGRAHSDPGQLLAAMASVDPAILRIALYDRRGQRQHASSADAEVPGITAAVRALLEGPLVEGGSLRILPPSGRFGRSWEIPILFVVTDAQGGSAGALLAVLDTGYFLGLYRRVDVGRSGLIRIADGEGSLLAEADRSGMALVAGRSLAGTPDGEPGQTASHLVVENDHNYLSSISQLGRYPLQVGVARDVEELLADYRVSRSRTLSVLGSLSALLVILAVWLVVNFHRQGRLLRSLQEMNEHNVQLIGQLEEERNRAFTLAAHDHLTGLNNRRMFQELVSSHLSRAKRSRQHYALMFLDLDRFKGINDTLGHHVGDLLLQTIAARLRACMRESDVVARLGGDEFAVLLTGLESISDVELIARKAIDQIAQPCPDMDGHDLHVTPSIGIAIFPRDGADFEALCRSADSAMYQAKRSGRGRHVFYDPSLNHLDERQFNLDQRLAFAIASGELVVHYQPKIRLEDNRIVGMEALVRWQHPDLGLIYPGDFIPLAEAQGEIGALGAWVFDACCRQLLDWQRRGVGTIPIAVNVAASQLLDDSLPGVIETALKHYDLPGYLFEVEVTESSLVDSFESAARVLGALQALGVLVALDDFGSGYANFGYLRAMAIHRLKIDRSFISDIDRSRENSAIVDSIISLAHRLDKKVVAEGVETRQQMMHLRTVGCDEIQGYYISRPVPAAEAEILLQRRFLEAT